MQHLADYIFNILKVIPLYFSAFQGFGDVSSSSFDICGKAGEFREDILSCYKIKSKAIEVQMYVSVQEVLEFHSHLHCAPCHLLHTAAHTGGTVKTARCTPLPQHPLHEQVNEETALDVIGCA